MKLDKEKMYLISEAAEFFPFLTERKISRKRTVWKWVKSGKIKAIRIGRNYRILGAEIKKVLTNGTNESKVR